MVLLVWLSSMVSQTSMISDNLSTFLRSINLLGITAPRFLVELVH